MLDLFLTRLPDPVLISPVVTDMCLSDHFVMTAALPFPKPKRVVNSVTSRNINAINLSNFKTSLLDSLTNIKDSITSCSLFNCVNNVLKLFAPLKTKIINVRPAAPWMNIVIKAQKKVRRQAERLYRKIKLTIHRDIFKYQKNKTTKIINEEKSKYISNQITSYV